MVHSFTRLSNLKDRTAKVITDWSVQLRENQSHRCHRLPLGSVNSSPLLSFEFILWRKIWKPAVLGFGYSDYSSLTTRGWQWSKLKVRETEWRNLQFDDGLLCQSELGLERMADCSYSRNMTYLDDSALTIR